MLLTLPVFTSLFFNSRVAWRMRCRTRLAVFIFGYLHIYALHMAETRHPSRKRATCTCCPSAVLPDITRSKQHIIRVVGNWAMGGSGEIERDREIERGREGGRRGGEGYLQAMTNYLQQTNHNEK